MGRRNSSRIRLEVWNYFGLERIVQIGQRLIEEQEPRGGEQGARQGDPLLFTAGKMGDPAFGQ